MLNLVTSNVISLRMTMSSHFKGYYILIVICLCAVAVAISMAFLALTREYITRGQLISFSKGLRKIITKCCLTIR